MPIVTLPTPQPLAYPDQIGWMIDQIIHGDLQPIVSKIPSNILSELLVVVYHLNMDGATEMIAHQMANRITHYSETIEDDEEFARTVGIAVDTTPEQREAIRREFFTYHQ